MLTLTLARMSSLMQGGTHWTVSPVSFMELKPWMATNSLNLGTTPMHMVLVSSTSMSPNPVRLLCPIHRLLVVELNPGPGQTVEIGPHGADCPTVATLNSTNGSWTMMTTKFTDGQGFTLVRLIALQCYSPHHRQLNQQRLRIWRRWRTTYVRCR